MNGGTVFLSKKACSQRACVHHALPGKGQCAIHVKLDSLKRKRSRSSNPIQVEAEIHQVELLRGDMDRFLAKYPYETLVTTSRVPKRSASKRSAPKRSASKRGAPTRSTSTSTALNRSAPRRSHSRQLRHTSSQENRGCVGTGMTRLQQTEETVEAHEITTSQVERTHRSYNEDTGQLQSEDTIRLTESSTSKAILRRTLKKAITQWTERRVEEEVKIDAKLCDVEAAQNFFLESGAPSKIDKSRCAFFRHPSLPLAECLLAHRKAWKPLLCPFPSTITRQTMRLWCFKQYEDWFDAGYKRFADRIYHQFTQLFSRQGDFIGNELNLCLNPAQIPAAHLTVKYLPEKWNLLCQLAKGQDTLLVQFLLSMQICHRVVMEGDLSQCSVESISEILADDVFAHLRAFEKDNYHFLGCLDRSYVVQAFVRIANLGTFEIFLPRQIFVAWQGTPLQWTPKLLKRELIRPTRAHQREIPVSRVGNVDLRTGILEEEPEFEHIHTLMEEIAAAERDSDQE